MRASAGKNRSSPGRPKKSSYQTVLTTPLASQPCSTQLPCDSRNVGSPYACPRGEGGSPVHRDSAESESLASCAPWTAGSSFITVDRSRHSETTNGPQRKITRSSQ